MTGRFNRGEWGWLSSEFAAQPYFSLINIFLFANYFANTLSPDSLQGQAYWGYTQAAAGVLIAVLTPILGAVADVTGKRKPWLVGFSAACAVSCIALWWAQPGDWIPGIALLVIAAATTLEFVIAFTSAMLPDIAKGRRVGTLSATGYGISQIAGILALVLVLIAFQLPGRVEAGIIPAAPLFGLDHALFETERISGPVAGLWLALFMIPLFLFTPDRPSIGARGMRAIADGIRKLWATLSDLRGHGNAMRFLVARMLYNDGMQAVFAFGGVVAGAVLGWGALELAVFGIAVTLCSGLGGFAGVTLDARLGSRRTIIMSLVVVTVTAFGLVTFEPDRIFLVLDVAPRAADAAVFSSQSECAFMAVACVFGLAIGPVIASSRTLMAHLAPEGKSTEFFGLYALSGKATAFAAPLSIAMLTEMTGNRMLGLSAILVFLAAGFAVLLTVREK